MSPKEIWTLAAARRSTEGAPLAERESVRALLLSIPAYPFWSLCIFALAIIILYELAKAPERRTPA